MNDLLFAMSKKMGIMCYSGESRDSYIYRLCYSALGQWCLQTARNVSNGEVGTSKHNQTIVLNELIQRYTELFPNISEKFIDTKRPYNKLSVFIHKVYEETGYLIVSDNNYNRIANYGRCIPIEDMALYFGFKNPCVVNGLGVFSKPTAYQVEINEFLIRDMLKSEEYFDSQFDFVDFFERDIDISDLQFFNPISDNVPSRSWETEIKTTCTIARKTEQGPFYRIRVEPNETILFADEPIEKQTDSLLSYEYRRLYFSLKAHYKKPLKATISYIDENYSRLKTRGQLPNREYYFLLLVSWPANNAFDKVNFILKNVFIQEVTKVLTNIGISVNIEGENANG